MTTLATRFWQSMGAVLLSTPAWGGVLQDCPVAPFADLSVAQRAVLVTGACRHDSSRLNVQAPRPRPGEVGTGMIRAEYSSLTSVRASGLLSVLKFDWAGARLGDAAGTIRTERRTELSVGTLMRLMSGLSLQTNLGLEHTDVSRTRATVSSIWQPGRMGLLFAEWAGSEAGTEAHRVGGRLWLVPRKFAVEMGARYLPNGLGWVDQHIGVALKLAL